ncbi:MAG: radical SAM protein [Lachnospiraceae bacterium]|nr:radical SAM protein [Lachnospiraceae bacterium]
MNDILTAWITTNYSCNLNCKWCYARNALDSDKTLSFENAKKIVDSLIALKIHSIVLIGGEPTCYDNLPDLIRYIKKQDPSVVVALTTNGILLSDAAYVKNLTDSGLEKCNISIKAFTRDDFAKVTESCNGFDNVITGIRNVQNSTCDLMVSYVISDADISKIDLLHSFCISHDIKRVLIQYVKPSVQMNSDPVMPMQDMVKTTEYIYKTWDNRVDYSIEISYPVCLIDKTVFEKMRTEKKITMGCHVQTGTGLNFDTEARIIPCNHFIDFPYDNKPHLTTDSIVNLCSSEMFKTTMNKACSYPSVKCKECGNWNICRGGCFTRWFYEDPDKVIPSF